MAYTVDGLMVGVEPHIVGARAVPIPNQWAAAEHPSDRGVNGMHDQHLEFCAVLVIQQRSAPKAT